MADKSDADRDLERLTKLTATAAADSANINERETAIRSAVTVLARVLARAKDAERAAYERGLADGQRHDSAHMQEVLRRAVEEGVRRGRDQAKREAAASSNDNAPGTESTEGGRERVGTGATTDPESFLRGVLSRSMTRPVLVYFHSDKCPPCSAASNATADAASRLADKCRVVRVDVDLDPAIAAYLKVTVVPAWLMFSCGRAVRHEAGPHSAGEVRRWVEDWVQDVAGHADGGTTRGADEADPTWRTMYERRWRGTY